MISIACYDHHVKGVILADKVWQFITIYNLTYVGNDACYEMRNLRCSRICFIGKLYELIVGHLTRKYHLLCISDIVSMHGVNQCYSI